MYKMIRYHGLGAVSLAFATALLGGCSDLITRFDYNESPAPVPVRQDVQTTASISPNNGHIATTSSSPVVKNHMPPVAQAEKPVRVPLFKSNLAPTTTPQAITDIKPVNQPVRSSKAITFDEYRAMQKVPVRAIEKQAPWTAWKKTPARTPRASAPLHTASINSPTAFSENNQITVNRIIQPQIVVVSEGQTLYSLARQHNSTVQSIMQANGLSSHTITVGQKLLVPTSVSKKVTPASKAPGPLKADIPNPVRQSNRPSVSPSSVTANTPNRSPVHVVVARDSLKSLSEAYKVSWTALAALNNMEPDAKLVPGTLVKIPGYRTSGTAQPTSAASSVTKTISEPRASVSDPKDRKTAEAIFTQSITVKRIPATETKPNVNTVSMTVLPKDFSSLPVKRKPSRQGVTATHSIASSVLPAPRITPKIKQVALAMPKSAPKPTAPKSESLVNLNPEANKARIDEFGFRWPVQGRIIRDFGAFPGGEFNEGINIAVPEGTDIRAAEAGEIAYAGNDHKQYGQLVVIYHADNWVTVYAHNKRLDVKQGDKVKRGQVIAEAGATGDVDSPQLHFQIRKSAKAHNPLANLPES